jgi:hypothetical protein
MLGYGVHLLKVTIPLAIRVTRCDTYWFDAYSAEPNPDYIDKYWSGACRYEKRPTWEYLVDGMIEANDPEGMEYLRARSRMHHGQLNAAIRRPVSRPLISVVRPIAFYSKLR